MFWVAVQVFCFDIINNMQKKGMIDKKNCQILQADDKLFVSFAEEIYGEMVWN